MVSTARVTNLYPRLTPRERLQMLGAAIRRGDQIEEFRLRERAPSECFSQPNYMNLACTLRWCVYAQRMTQLGYAAEFWQAHARLAWALDPVPGEAGENAEFWRGYADINEYFYAVNRDGWQLFLEEGGIDLEVLADPAREIGQLHILDYLDEIASVPTDIEARLREFLSWDGAECPKSLIVLTPHDVAADWHRSIRKIEAWSQN